MITFGADPEVFLVDEALEGSPIVPAADVCPGTKNNPLRLRGGVTAHADNIMLELGVPPVEDPSQLVSATVEALSTTIGYVREWSGRRSLAPRVVPYVELPSDEVLQMSNSQELGCSADYCAYRYGEKSNGTTLLDFVSPSDPSMEYRFAGGHLHFGYDNPDNVPPYVVAALLDVAVGVPMLLIEKQGPRRALYGTAGRYRPKPYGLEYRVPSNAWLSGRNRTGTVVTWALHAAWSVLECVEKRDDAALRTIFEKTDWNLVRNTIETENTAIARDFLLGRATFGAVWRAILPYAMDDEELAGTYTEDAA